MKLSTKIIATGFLIGSLFALGGCGGGGGSTTVPSTGTPGTPKIYVIGDSFSSDGTKSGTSGTNISGDARYVNGPIGGALWVERYANAVGALAPVSNTRTPGASQSATNFARGSSFALGDSDLIPTSTATSTAPTTDASLICQPSYTNTNGADCGSFSTTLTKHPANAYDQWLLIKAALGSSAPGASDVLTIESGGNDLIMYHINSVRTASAGDPFVQRRADVVALIAQEAATLGFKKIIIANALPADQTPYFATFGWSSAQLGYLATDIASLNSKILAKINAPTTGLKTVNSATSFYLADWHTAMTNALATPSLAGVTVVASDAGSQTTTVSATLDAFWWDTDRYHPTALLHNYAASNFILKQ